MIRYPCFLAVIFLVVSEEGKWQAMLLSDFYEELTDDRREYYGEDLGKLKDYYDKLCGKYEESSELCLKVREAWITKYLQSLVSEKTVKLAGVNDYKQVYGDVGGMSITGVLKLNDEVEGEEDMTITDVSKSTKRCESSKTKYMVKAETEQEESIIIIIICTCYCVIIIIAY